MSAIVVRVLGAGDGSVLDDVADGVFDYDVRQDLTTELLEDPRHHLAVALDGSTVVGMASALVHIHPDKPAQLWVNEVGVADSHLRQGLATRLMEALIEHARTLGCETVWVLTENENGPAVGLYESMGGRRMEGIIVGFEWDLRADA